MRQFLGILIIVGVFLLAKQLITKYQSIKKEQSGPEVVQTPATPSSTLPGLPAALEGTLQAAQKQGAEGLAIFLRQYRHAIRDPRLGSIELDYVVLVSLKDPAEARRVFKSVQQRTPNSSPLHDRIKSLERTYP